jgi:membrane fusion protein (multidrug efflux system)
MTPSNPHHRTELGVLALAFALGSIVGLTSGCSSPASAKALDETTPITVETAAVEERSIQRTVTVTGTLAANREADVASDTAGRVVATFVERGDRIQAGAPLARLDARAAALGSAEAFATEAGLRAQDDNARIERERAERLFAEGVISRAERDRIVTNSAATSHSLSAARARAGLAQKGVSDALIRAPFAGVVVDRGVELGEYVAPGRNVATIVDVSKLRLELSVPEPAMTAVGTGKTVTFEVAAYPEREFSGSITRLSPKLRAQSRDRLVEVEVDNANGTLSPGMFAVARLVTGHDRLPTVPATAVAGRAPAERVFVVKNSRVEERIVSTGAHRDGRAPVKKGLAVGEVVVTNPTEAVRDGVRVK